MKEFIVLCHSLKTAYPEKVCSSRQKGQVGGAVVGLDPNSENLRIGSLKGNRHFQKLWQNTGTKGPTL